MIIIRPIRPTDEPAYNLFAGTSHAGITNMPNDPELLHDKITLSLDSFNKEVAHPGKEFYLFILEDTETGEKGGTCGIYAKTGTQVPYYFYRVETLYHDTHSLPMPTETRVLHPVIHRSGPSEICGLYLLPQFRRAGIGRLLSLSRFLFMASFPSRFDCIVLANMRGMIDSNDRSPFWDGLGKKFLQMEFTEVLTKSTIDKEFIPHFLPNYPIYVLLLPQDAQDAIGKTHVNTTPGLNLLTREGFRATMEIDIFDGGPIISARTKEIKTIQNSQEGLVAELSDVAEDAPDMIICNSRLDFRACFSRIKVLGKGLVILPIETAEALEVKVGDTVRYAKL